MSIPVQCPNPDCGKVHKAKNKYAGLKCYCPDCRAIMDVPRPGAAVAAHPAEEDLFAEELPARAPAAGNGVTANHLGPSNGERPGAGVEGLVGLGEGPAGTPAAEEADALSLNVARPGEEEVIAAEEEAAIQVEQPSRLAPAAEAANEDEAPPAPSRPAFRWGPAVLLALGGLSLLGIAAMPFLPGPKLTATGLIAKMAPLPNPGWGMRDEVKPYVIAIPAVLAGLVAVGLGVALLQRRFGIVPFLTNYPAAVGAALLLLLLSIGLQARLHDVRKVQEVVTNQRARMTGAQADQLGTASLTVGTNMWTAFFSAVAAFALLGLSLPLLHRRKWAKVVSGVLFGLSVAAETLVVFLILWLGS